MTIAAGREKRRRFTAVLPQVEGAERSWETGHAQASAPLGLKRLLLLLAAAAQARSATEAAGTGKMWCVRGWGGVGGGGPASLLATRSMPPVLGEAQGKPCRLPTCYPC